MFSGGERTVLSQVAIANVASDLTTTLRTVPSRKTDRDVYLCLNERNSIIGDKTGAIEYKSPQSPTFENRES
jgi:hypothetical protein